jgi:hypothetical protein
MSSGTGTENSILDDVVGPSRGCVRRITDPAGSGSGLFTFSTRSHRPRERRKDLDSIN